MRSDQGTRPPTRKSEWERPSGALPLHLASKKAFKTDAEAKFAAARAAHEVLSKELVAASGHLLRQEVAVQRAAGAVLSAEAPPLIEELYQVRRTVGRWRPS